MIHSKIMVQMRRTTRRRRKNSKSNRRGDRSSPNSKRKYTRRKVKHHSPRRATTPPLKLNPSAPKKRKYAKRLGKTKMKGGFLEGLFKNKDTSIVDSLVDRISKLTPEKLEEFKVAIDKIPGLKESLLAPPVEESSTTKVADESVVDEKLPVVDEPVVDEPVADENSLVADEEPVGDEESVGDASVSENKEAHDDQINVESDTNSVENQKKENQ